MTLEKKVEIDFNEFETLLFSELSKAEEQIVLATDYYKEIVKKINVHERDNKLYLLDYFKKEDIFFYIKKKREKIGFQK